MIGIELLPFSACAHASDYKIGEATIFLEIFTSPKFYEKMISCSGDIRQFSPSPTASLE